MANDYMAWATNGPLPHNPRLAREQVWRDTQGQTGINGPLSFECRAAPSPSGVVHVMPGGATIAATPEHQTMSTGYTDAPFQSYGVTSYQTIEVPIPQTTSAGPRLDTIGIIINDPEFEGTFDDVDWDNHRIWDVHRIPNASVGATRPHHFGAVGRPFLPLAQVHLPASRTYVTNDDIRDIRFLANRREDTQTALQEANPTEQNTVLRPSQTNWFDLAEIEGFIVPQWATHVKINGEITTATSREGAVNGLCRIGFNATTGWYNGVETNFREGSPWDRFQIPFASRIAIDDDARNTGRTARVRVQLRRSGGDGDLLIPTWNDYSSFIKITAVFEEAPRDTIAS